MNVIQLLFPFALAPHIEIVKSLLPVQSSVVSAKDTRIGWAPGLISAARQILRFAQDDVRSGRQRAIGER